MANKPKPIVRLQVNLSESESAQVDQIIKEEHISKSGLIRKLMRLYLLLKKLQDEGGKFYSERKDGSREIIHFL